MHRSSIPIATLAEIRDDADQRVAILRCRLTDDRLVIDTLPDPAADAWRETLAPVSEGVIRLLPNGMLRLALADGEEVGLADYVRDVTGGRLRLVKDSQGVEQGLAMKQRLWAQEEHSVPFQQLVARLQDTSRRN